MAKTNKFTSINFNHIYEKNLSTNSNSNSNNKTHASSNNPIKNPSSSSSSSTPFSYSAISSPSTKTHGRMLILTRPTPKPIFTPPSLSPQPQPLPQLQSQPQQAQQLPGQIRSEPRSDAISLHPLGRTGSGSVILPPVTSQGREKETTVLVSSPKPDKFVPPHLRPGFVGKEDRHVITAREAGQKHCGPSGRYWEDGRPKSGGGNERMTRGGDSNLGMMTRPRSSSGNRPSSSGCGLNSFLRMKMRVS